MPFITGVRQLGSPDLVLGSVHELHEKGYSLVEQTTDMISFFSPGKMRKQLLRRFSLPLCLQVPCQASQKMSVPLWACILILYINAMSIIYSLKWDANSLASRFSSGNRSCGPSWAQWKCVNKKWRGRDGEIETKLYGLVLTFYLCSADWSKAVVYLVWVLTWPTVAQSLIYTGVGWGWPLANAT